MRAVKKRGRGRGGDWGWVKTNEHNMHLDRRRAINMFRYW